MKSLKTVLGLHSYLVSCCVNLQQQWLLTAFPIVVIADSIASVILWLECKIGWFCYVSVCWESRNLEENLWIKYRFSRATVDSSRSWAGMCTFSLNLNNWST